MLKGNVIIIRGHSGSGKSTVSAGVMQRLREGGERICYIDLDYFSWVMPGGTQEGDAPFTKEHVKKLVNEMLFSAITTAINCNFNVVFEGVLSINRFKDIFERLQAVPNILCHFVYLDVPLSVTLERHKGRDKCQTIPESDIIRWRKNERDEKTHYPNELVIQGGALPLDDIVEAIVNHVKVILYNKIEEKKDVNTWYPINDGSSQYKGEWKNGVPHGKGIHEMFEDNSYGWCMIEGNFVNGFIEGYCKQLYKQDGEETQPYYEGEIYKDKHHGKGAYYYGNGSYYRGNFKDGKFHGIGYRYYVKKNQTWVGEFENDNMSEKGVWIDGELY
jgi:adenylate kinase family enzyme